MTHHLTRNAVLASLLFVLAFTEVEGRDGGIVPARGAARTDALSLDGAWRFCLDPENRGFEERWYRTSLREVIWLPGTTDLAGYGDPGEVESGHLVRPHRYVGVSWYQRDIEVPDDWAGRTVELCLERVLWESRVWVDDRFVGAADSLTTPHRHVVGELEPGPHRITVRVDNGLIANIGTMSHSYTEETQSIWNGIVGRIELRQRPAVYIASIDVRPDGEEKRVAATIRVEGVPVEGIAGRVLCRLERGDAVLGESEKKLELKGSMRPLSLMVASREPVHAWDEFSPFLYELEVDLVTSEGRDTKRVPFGFRDIRRVGRRLLLNGRPLQLRGTTECCVFPRTGHPPTDVASWTRMWRVVKNHGLNHVRFHSWCPPAAAFTAADHEGVYLQVETPLWIDAWMARRTSSKPQLFGQDPAVVAFIRAEVARILEEYGNHPSFCMLALGNELHSSSDYRELERIVEDARRRHPNRVYSVSTARVLTSVDDFYVSHATPGGPARGIRHGGTDWDLGRAVRSVRVPLIAHEIGQRPVFPDYSALEKYSGPLKPWNLEKYRVALEARGMLSQNRAFTTASWKWAAGQYRHEIEAVLRTREYCGFQLLQLNDFPGQGEALVGLLDPFWERKCDVSAHGIQKFCGPTVPLLRFGKYIWSSNEEFLASALISHFGPHDIAGAEVTWRMIGANGTEMASGGLGQHDLPTGERTTVGTFSVPLAFAKEAECATVELRVRGAAEESSPVADTFVNDWKIWIYPPRETAPWRGDVLVSRFLRAREREALQDGGSVLLVPLEAEGDLIFPGRFFSVYWSAAFFPTQDGTLGVLCDPRHPALRDFPTESHADWQWRPLLEDSRYCILDWTPREYRPIVQPISDFHTNHKLGAVFETKVGPGKLLVCGLNVFAKSPAAHQMQASLLAYMGSPAFDPKDELDLSLLKTLSEPLEEESQ